MKSAKLIKQPRAVELPAAPSGRYAEMVRERQKLYDDPGDGLKLPLVINLPGLGGRKYSHPNALFYLGAAVHHHAEEILAALVPAAGSAWELVELEELLVLCDGLCGDSGETLIPADVRQPAAVYMRRRTGLLTKPKITGSELIVFVAFTLHYHADAISRLVIPKLQIAEAVELAEALMVAEKLVWLIADLSDKHLGTFEKPTELQALVWKLTARLWQEWPRNLSFDRVLQTTPAEPSYLERMQGTGPEVAA